MTVKGILFVGAVAISAAITRAQTPVDPAAPPPESKRLFGLIPNFRTASFPAHYIPLSASEKFHIAALDSFDRGTIALGLLFGAENDWTNANRSFGQGTAGYAKYAAASYGDFMIGDFMTEAIYPSLLHQDPRYFRLGKGSGWRRFGYAVHQVFWTYNDNGRMGFNYSEIAGNATAVAISRAYYQDSRTARDSAVSVGSQVGVDAASNVLKEFWPDINRKLHWRH